MPLLCQPPNASITLISGAVVNESISILTSRLQFGGKMEGSALAQRE